MEGVDQRGSDGGGPLLIAIHGATGSGKTTLAATLAAEVAVGARVTGWLQPAVGERGASGGACRYDWQPLDRDTEAQAYLERDDGVQPPYRSVPTTETAIDAWIDRLTSVESTGQPLDLLVIDEVGAVELAGGGHRARIDRLRGLDPGAIIVVINSRHLDAVAQLLGQRFDVSVDAGDPSALQKLRDVLVARRDFERVGWFGALAGGLEVSAGSVVHGARIPFGGLGMATAQAAVLTRAAQPLIDRGRVVWVALLSAAIKSLSPAGQRLRPMLAIAMQGWLYARALRLLGWNLGAVATGGFLMGMWAASQGLLMQWLLVGDALAIALGKLNEEVAGLLGLQAPSLALLIAGWIAAHGAVVASGTVLAWRRGARALEATRLPRWFSPPAIPSRRGWGATLLQAARDMLRPTFWVPILLILGALAWAGQPNETLLWVALRALLIAWVLFVLVQRVNLPALPARLRSLGMWGPAIAWRRALARLDAGSRG